MWSCCDGCISLPLPLLAVSMRDEPESCGRVYSLLITQTACMSVAHHHLLKPIASSNILSLVRPSLRAYLMSYGASLLRCRWNSLRTSCRTSPVHTKAAMHNNVKHSLVLLTSMLYRKVHCNSFNTTTAGLHVEPEPDVADVCNHMCCHRPWHGQP